MRYVEVPFLTHILQVGPISLEVLIIVSTHTHILTNIPITLPFVIILKCSILYSNKGIDFMHQSLSNMVGEVSAHSEQESIMLSSIGNIPGNASG